MAADYDTLVYTEVGGSKLVVADGGEIEIQSGGTLDVLSGATFNFGTFGASMVVNQTDNYPVGIFGNITVAQTTGTTTQRALWARMDVDANLSGTASVTGAELQFRYDGATSIGSGAETEQYSGAWLYFEQDTSGDTLADYCHAAACFASVETHSDLSLSANTHLSGIEIASRLGASDGVAWADTTGTTAALFITKAPAATGVTASNWPYGIVIENITTAINVAACTTGINLSGAMTDGIIIGGACSSNGVEITGTCTGAGVFLGTTNKLMFHDTGMYMRASADGHLEIVSDDTITLSSPGHGSIVFGGETDWGAGSTGHDIDGSGWDWVTQTVGHVDSGALGAACAASYNALSVTTTSHTSTSSFFGTWTELYFVASCVLTGASNAAAVWGQVEGLGALTSPDSGDFVTGGYFNVKTGGLLTLTDGSNVSGVRVKGEINSKTGTGILSAFSCTAVTTDWAYGMYLEAIETGIYLGACDTACIHMATGQVTGINIAGTCSTAGISMGALSTGGQALLVTWTGVGDEATAAAAGICSLTLTSNANAGSDNDLLIGYHVSITAGTDDQANNILVGTDSIITVGKNIDSCAGGRFTVVLNDASGVVDDGAAAVYAVATATATSTITAGPFTAVWAQYDGAAAITTSAGDTSCFFGDIDEDIDIGLDFDVADAKTCTTGIELGVTSTGAYTTGIAISGAVTDGIVFSSTIANSGIDFQGCTPNLTDDDESIIKIGGYDNALAITGELTDNFFGQSIHIDLQEDPDADQWIAPIYLKFKASTEAQPHTQAVTCMIRADVQQAIASMYGIQSHVKFTSPGDTASEVIGVSAQIYGTHAGSGYHWGVKSDLRQAGCPSGAGHLSACFFGVGTVDISCGLYLEALSTKTMYSGIYLHGAGTITNGIEFNGTVTTGLNFTSGCTITEGIDFGGVTLTTDAARENSFIKCGTVTTQKEMTPTDQAYLFQMNVKIMADLTSSKRVIGHYNKLETGAALTSTRLKVNENYCVVGHAVEDAHVVYGELYYASGYTEGGVTNEGFGGAFTVDTNGGSTPTGLLYGIKARIKGTNLSTAGFLHCAAFFVTENSTWCNTRFTNLSGATIDSMISFNQAGTCTNLLRLAGTTTNLIKFDAASAPLTALAADVAGDNTTHKLAIDIGGSTYYLAVWGSGAWS